MSDQGSLGDTSGSSELKAGHPPASMNKSFFLFTNAKKQKILFDTFSN